MATPSKARRMLAKVYKLVKTTWGKVLILFTSFPFLRYLYNLIDAWGNLKMVTDGFPSIWSWIVWGWSYINTTAGSMVVSALGISLIALQLHRQDRRTLVNGKEKPAELAPAQGEQPTIHTGTVDNLTEAFPCPDTWLHKIANLQEESIHVAIRVLDCTLLYKDLESAAPLVNFNFHILNTSVHSLTVEKNIDGWVDFAGRRLGGHLRRTDSYGPLGQGQSGYFVITQWLSKEELNMIMSSDSQCMYSFENLEVSVRGDERFPEDRKVIPQRLEIRCRIQRIGQGVLENDLANNTRWLTEIAEDQAKTIFRFVHLVKVRFGKHELLREHPYMEFVFDVDNRSLYDIRFDDLSGAISFAGRELTEQPTWQDRPAITHHNVGSVTVRERLTKGDVTKILNGLSSDKFDFAGLTIKVNGNHDLQSTPVHVHHLEITNDLLLTEYPKLEIEITSAKFDWVDDTRIGAHPPPLDEPCFVTLFLTIKNQRRTSLAVEVFKLTLEIEGKEYVSFAEDTVFEYRSVDALGGELGQGSHPNNFNAKTPLMLIEDKAVEGSLQFMFKDLRYIASLTDGIEVKNAPFTLLLIDKDQERHTVQGFLPAEGFRYIKNLSRNTKSIDRTDIP